MKKLIVGCLLTLTMSVSAHVVDYKELVKLNKSDDNTIPSVEIGAQVFIQRCSLCHGTQGMGEGRVPLKIDSYPNTNIMLPKKAQNSEDMFDIVVYGGLLSSVDKHMPPFGNELTWTEIQSVVQFISGLRETPEEYLSILAVQDTRPSKDLMLGKNTYEARCVLCHGINGDGKGRMAKIIKNPPPYDLTKSLMPEAYLTKIIESGGEGVGRSPQMPPWGDQLSATEIQAVVDYIVGIRVN